MRPAHKDTVKNNTQVHSYTAEVRCNSRVFRIYPRKPKTRPAGWAMKTKALLRKLEEESKEFKEQLIKDLEAGAAAKEASCIVNGRFSYDKMSELYHKGKW